MFLANNTRLSNFIIALSTTSLFSSRKYLSFGLFGKNNKILREDIVHNSFISNLNDLICPSEKVFSWIIKNLKQKFENSYEQAEEYKKSIVERIKRLEKMDDTLYDDKLNGEISKERYKAKHDDILKQTETLKEDLVIAELSVSKKYAESIDILELTQNAKQQYLDENLTNESKRDILAKLFEYVEYKDSIISVKRTYLAESIAKKNKEIAKIMKSQNTTCKTNRKDLDNRGQNDENIEFLWLRPIWQG